MSQPEFDVGELISGNLARLLATDPRSLEQVAAALRPPEERLWLVRIATGLRPGDLDSISRACKALDVHPREFFRD